MCLGTAGRAIVWRWWYAFLAVSNSVPGGLVRAYSSAVSQALDGAQWRQITPATPVQITTDFATEERVRHRLQQAQLVVEGADYRERVYLLVSVPLAELEPLRASLQTLTQGRAELRVLTPAESG